MVKHLKKCNSLVPFKESRGQALRHPLEHDFVLEKPDFQDKWVPEEPVPVPHVKG
jgi:hypothetical protein